MRSHGVRNVIGIVATTASTSHNKPLQHTVGPQRPQLHKPPCHRQQTLLFASRRLTRTHGNLHLHLVHGDSSLAAATDAKQGYKRHFRCLVPLAFSFHRGTGTPSIMMRDACLKSQSHPKSVCSSSASSLLTYDPTQLHRPSSPTYPFQATHSHQQQPHTDTATT